ncbi:MAG: multicopper oxidase domain-containing protein [Saprospiraceae bacterium]|nr:multicopper oxidase domain-containing protein [Candidatus Brachybacter algidus]
MNHFKSNMMPHPFHIHGNHFFVLSVNGATSFKYARKKMLLLFHLWRFFGFDHDMMTSMTQ